MIQGCINRNVDTVVVVAPTIVLCNQLSREFMEFIDNRRVCVIHSGGHKVFYYYRPTRHQGSGILLVGKRLSSLPIIHCVGIQLAGIRVDTIYFDESHNSVKSNFHDV